MEENKNLRLDLLMANDYNVENAKKCYDFVMGDEAEEKKLVVNIAQGYPDGIYYVMANGEYRLYQEDQKGDIEGCVGIGIKYGSRALVVSYRDMACHKDLTLTKCKDKTTGYSGYIDDITDAVADWNGKDNTDHLYAIGLNDAIQLEPGQWIPSLGELYFIYTNKKAINKALAHVVGADYIADLWYWSSTEYSAAIAWYLNLNSGIASISAKATLQYRVRAVSAFLH